MTTYVKYCLINIFCCLCTFYLTNGNESKEELPFCGVTESHSRYIFVSTLDGKLTALNPNDDGSVVWSIHPGSQSMLSSSIHKLELSNYGHLVRMIPSLNGGLYKFNGENIEVIPVTVDSLLQSSFKYSDDLVISGGKETQTYGVFLRSGHIIYECSMKGCGNVSHSTDGNDVLVIQRLGQIVRAVEPRTGAEKWNFSVAQHDLKLLSECHSAQSIGVNYVLKAIVPEGLIYAIDLKNPSLILWKQKFSSPIVNVWQLDRGQLTEVDLFNGYQSAYMDSVIPPSIYIGMHDKQLYIQESNLMLKKREEITSKIKHKLIGHVNNYPRIPWKPHPASATALNVIYSGLIDSENSLDDTNQRQTTALSVLYASPYVDGNGFYLFSEEESDKEKKDDSNVLLNEDDREENEKDFHLSSDSDFNFEHVSEGSDVHTSVEITIVSFWCYWKEVLVISATTLFLYNLIMTRTFFWQKIKGSSKTLEEKKLSSSTRESNSCANVNLDKQSNILNSDSMEKYSSRYLNDFEPVACLGKGGFGVVFEAKNKIDDCHYAIKRILLPNKLEYRERVMREVKALAKLDHHHIVRYFNAWTECPPPGWQENYDKSWVEKNKDIFTSNEIISTEATSTSLAASCKSSVLYNVSSFDSSLNHLQNLKGETDFSKNDISDSFIVFGNASQRDESDTKSFHNKDERILTLNFESEEADYGLKTEKLPESVRPTSLFLSQNHIIESQSLNKVYLYIQMQLCQRQSLRDWLIVNSKRDYRNVLNIFEQILQAVEYVHLHGLIHRDLKPSNIFFSLDNQIKVGDFGLVTAMTENDIQMSPSENSPMKVDERHTAQVGTQLYMSQEQLLGKAYNYKVDIYSLGLILFELLVPFSTQMERISVLQNIKNNKYPVDFQEKYENEHELLRLMLSHFPDERPTTYGIRARLPLKQEPVEESWHFDLPMRHRTYSKTSRASTSSNEGSSDTR